MSFLGLPSTRRGAVSRASDGHAILEGMLLIMLQRSHAAGFSTGNMGSTTVAASLAASSAGEQAAREVMH